MDTPLRRIRKARGLSLQALADASGVDKSNLSRLERRMGKVSAEAAADIVKVLGKGISELHILYPERYMKKAAA